MNKFFRTLLLAILITVNLAAAPIPGLASIPQTGSKITDPDVDTSLPSLDTFIKEVGTGLASQVTGLYAADVFAFPVVQQPSGQPAYVSPSDGKLTQFGMASSYGSLGFLAHNTLAGAKFSNVMLNQVITVVYGDGHFTLYQVTEIRRFQATSPASPYSSFLDLSSRSTLTATDLFYQTYGVKNTLVLQTCITSKGLDTWGRLFIIAAPLP